MRPDELTLEEQLIASTAVANYRRTNQVEKIQFQTNVPETIALKYADGKRVESRYNEYEQYYTLADGRALYASPALHAKIEAFAPQPGEFFVVTKAEIRDGQRKRIEWQVEAEGQKTPAAPPPPAPRLVPPAPRPAEESGSLRKKAEESGSSPVSAPGTMTQIMGGALIAAIDALDAAAKYARDKHNWELMFGPEDVRATSASIFIAYTRELERKPQTTVTQSFDRVNGGYRA